jgi:hypothetical protein
MTHWFGCLATVVASALVAGCAQPEVAADLESDVPQERIMGLAEAARRNDPDAADDYVVMLESSDPAVRMFAIGALERLTGETKGYDYAAPESDRAPAVAAWTAWVAAGGVRGGAGASGVAAQSP